MQSADALAEAGEGWLHRVDGRTETEFAMRVHADEWPSRATLASLYRELGVAGSAGLSAEDARRVICGGERAHPRAPEVAARSTRVLTELGLVQWRGSGSNRTVGVVSSSGTELERSHAFVAYRERSEEGRRFLSERRQN